MDRDLGQTGQGRGLFLSMEGVRGGEGGGDGRNECRPNLWVKGRGSAGYRQTDRKYTGEVEEGQGRGADRKERGNRRDKWLVTWNSDWLTPLSHPQHFSPP